MVEKYIESSKGYYYKIIKGGGKMRVSKLEYNKKGGEKMRVSKSEYNKKGGEYNSPLSNERIKAINEQGRIDELSKPCIEVLQDYGLNSLYVPPNRFSKVFGKKTCPDGTRPWKSHYGKECCVKTF